MNLPDDAPDRRPALRASDADREATAEVLRAAAADGRLDLSELDERLNATFAAKTRPELDRITLDLPTGRAPVSRTEPLRLTTKSGSIKRTGRWQVPAAIIAESTSGTIKLDFTEAICPHPEVRIQARASSGTIVLVVPPGWGVTADDVSSTSGTIVNRVDLVAEPGRPHLIVSGGVKSGTIRARYPRTGFWRTIFGV